MTGARIIPWPTAAKAPQEPVQAVVPRPDTGAIVAALHLESQLGTVAAYESLFEVALILRLKIDAGNAKPPASP